MYKYIGLIILFLCSVFIGQTISAKYRLSVRQTDAFIQFIKYIKSQIEHYNTSYPEIFDKFTNNILHDFTDKLHTNEWISALDNTAFSFDDNIKEILYSFGHELGKSMRDEQIANCLYTIEQLEIHYNNLKSELPKKTKLCTSLSLMTGLSIVIIFI